MIKILVLVICLISFTIQKGFICHQIINNTLYKLSPLMRDYDYKFQFFQDEQQYEIIFNFCKTIQLKCNGQSIYSGQFFKQNQSQCISFSNSNFQNFLQGYELIDQYDPSQGIIQKYSYGDLYILNNSTNLSIQNPIPHYQLNIQIQCNPQIQTLQIDELEISQNIYNLYVKSSYGCPALQYSQMSQFFIDHYLITSLFLISIGIVQCFYGMQILIPLLFIVSSFFGFVISLLFFNEVLVSPNTGSFWFWLIVLLSVFSGGLIGYFAMMIPKYGYLIIFFSNFIGFFLLGATLGVTISSVLDELLFYKIPQSPSNLIFIIVSIILAIIFGILSFIAWRRMVILSTSIIGSYEIVRGFSLIFGHWPSNFDLSVKIKNGESIYDDNGDSFIFYLFIIIIIAYYGNRFQKDRELKKQEQESELNQQLVNNEIELNQSPRLSKESKLSESKQYNEVQQGQKKNGNESDQIYQIIEQIKENEYVQKINNHEITGKIKEQANKYGEKAQKAMNKALNKAEENLKKEEEKRKEKGVISLI